MNIHIEGALSLVTVRAQLAEIERAALAGASVSALSSLIGSITPGYITSTIYLSGSFFRARPRLAISELKTVNDLWYPPRENTPQGRVNEAQDPVFYCSANHETATREMILNVGDRVAVLKCKLKNPEQMIHAMAIGGLKKIIRTGRNIIDKKVTGAFDFRLLPPVIKNRALLIDAFFARTFTSQSEIYFNLTNAISKFYLGSSEIDGLVYPSVKKGGGFNLAMKAGSADRLLSPDAIYSAQFVRELVGNRMYMLRDYLAVVGANRTLAWYRAVKN